MKDDSNRLLPDYWEPNRLRNPLTKLWRRSAPLLLVSSVGLALGLSVHFVFSPILVVLLVVGGVYVLGVWYGHRLQQDIDAIKAGVLVLPPWLRQVSVLCGQALMPTQWRLHTPIGLALALLTLFQLYQENPRGPVTDPIWLLLVFPLILVSQHSETLVVVAWGVVALAGLLATRLLTGIPPNWDLFRDLGVAGLWLAALVGLLHFVLRKLRYLQIQEAFARSATQLLAPRLTEVTELIHPGPDGRASYYDQLTTEMATELAIPKLSAIAVLGSPPTTLTVRSAFGVERDHWYAKTWGMDDKSITAWTASQRKTLRCNNKAWSPIFMEFPGYHGTRSELAVPIVFGDSIFGVLDAQADSVGYFDDQYQAALEGLASSLGIAMAFARQEAENARRDFELVTSLLSNLGACSTLQDMLQALAHKVCDAFEADIVVAYSLSPYLCKPQRRPKWASRSPFPRNTNALLGEVSTATIFPDLLREWSQVFAPCSRDHPILKKSTFVQREEVKSTAILPLGTTDRKLGLLFVNFCREGQRFEAGFRFALTAVATVASLAMSLREARDARERYHRRLDAIRHIGMAKALSNIRSALNIHMAQVDSSGRDPALSVLREQTELLTRKVSDFLEPSLSHDRETAAVERLYSVVDELKKLYAHATFEEPLDVDEHINELPPELAEEIISLVHEAANNSLEHGQAPRLRIRIQRWPSKIVIKIIDSGRGFETSKVRKMPHGVFVRIAELAETYGGVSRIRGCPGLGAGVELTIPCWPPQIEGEMSHAA